MCVENESEKNVGVEKKGHGFSERKSATSVDVTVCLPGTRVKPERVVFFGAESWEEGSCRLRRRLMALLIEMSSSRAKDLARR